MSNLPALLFPILQTSETLKYSSIHKQNQCNTQNSGKSTKTVLVHPIFVCKTFTHSLYSKIIFLWTFLLLLQNFNMWRWSIFNYRLMNCGIISIRTLILVAVRIGSIVNSISTCCMAILYELYCKYEHISQIVNIFPTDTNCAWG